MKRLVLILGLAALLCSCADSFRQAKTDTSGYLPVGNDADLRVTVNQSVDTSQFRKILYVSTDMHGVPDWMGYQDYLMESFRQLDFFGEIVTREPTFYINTMPPLITKKFDDKKVWFDVVDPVSNRDIVNQYGPNVLVAKAILRNKSDDVGELGGFYFQLQLIEPSTSRVLFQASKTGNNTLGLDMNLINPVLNYAKGYLVYYDPYHVAKHDNERGMTQMLRPSSPTTPFSYEMGVNR